MTYLLVLLACVVAHSLAYPVKKQDDKVISQVKSGIIQLAEEMTKKLSKGQLAKMEKLAELMARCDYNDLMQAMAQAIENDMKFIKIMSASKKSARENEVKMEADLTSQDIHEEEATH